MKGLIIIVLSFVLLFVCGCVEAEKPVRWNADDSIPSESLFDLASDAFDEWDEENNDIMKAE